MMKTGGWFANILKKDLERLLRLESNDSVWWSDNMPKSVNSGHC